MVYMHKKQTGQGIDYVNQCKPITKRLYKMVYMVYITQKQTGQGIDPKCKL